MEINIKEFYPEIIATVLVIIIAIILKYVSKKIIKKISEVSEKAENRRRIITKYIDWMIYTLFIISLFGIWGIDTKNVVTYITSILAFIGVALFAQWSVLSNITAGIVMFFSFPYKIGDIIKIEDKDFPIQAEIEDIKTFHTILITAEGSKVTYPNNLFLQKAVVIVKSS
ncbi:mechanosensitive ion channel domain-containing protein [Flavobacterium sp. I3-2]|uniref:mechanosensitive ion channel domain-containing protein n=1 Tax=Flavobacterium sp. I3-2 TaxID=2748319 RepID=UPI0021039101|nr:mechanosensitive ion channel domain-containing protein [Flavobacterium sp. I3-2]